MPSPSRLMPTASRTIAILGNIVIHQELKITPFASYKMLPRLGMGAGMPAPKKLSAASRIMAMAKVYVPCTITGDRILGRIWENRTFRVHAPCDLIA